MNHKILEQIKGRGAFLAGDLPMSTSSIILLLTFLLFKFQISNDS
jgi:hypothetical protein